NCMLIDFHWPTPKAWLRVAKASSGSVARSQVLHPVTNRLRSRSFGISAKSLLMPKKSLLVAYQSPNGLMFAGRVGTGFTEKLLATIDAQLQKLRRATCPFINLPEKSRGRWGLGITPAVMKRCHWVKPVLIAQVKFTEWTHDNQLRQPVFLGLRTELRLRLAFVRSIAAVLTDRLLDFSAGPGEQLFRRREQETSAISHQMVLKRQVRSRSYQT